MALLMIGTALFICSLFFKPTWLIALISMIVFGLHFYLLEEPILTAFLFLAGVLLLLLELYIPTAGFVGLAGLVVIIYILFQQAASFDLFALQLLAMIGTAGVSFIGFLKAGRPLTFGSGFILEDMINATSSKENPLKETIEVGMTGVAKTNLRPRGTGEFEGQSFEVVSDEGFVPRGATIQVIRRTQQDILVTTTVSLEEENYAD